MSEHELLRWWNRALQRRLQDRADEIARLQAELQNERIENGRLLLEVLDWKDRWHSADETLKCCIKHCDDLLKQVGI